MYGPEVSVVKNGRGYSKGRKRRHVLRNRIIYVFLAFVLILISFIVYSILNPANPNLPDQTPKAAIVDHLSNQFPNQTFAQTIKAIVNETGLEVDYYPSEQVTVDFYRNLPMHNYKLILFRVHSTGESSVEGVPPFIVFFTSEEYSNTKHVAEQLDMRLVYTNFPEAEPPGYFGITPLFIENSLSRRFNDTIIIAMGCDGLKYTTMAEAFIEKGAKAYIGWNGSVIASHTDQAATCLIRHLITDRQTIEDSVANAMLEVGPDPIDASVLEFYPNSAADMIVQARSFNIHVDKTSLALRAAEISLRTLGHINHFPVFGLTVFLSTMSIEVKTIRNSKKKAVGNSGTTETSPLSVVQGIG